jgi:tetratricopeptide (TPR) repeat protein
MSRREKIEAMLADDPSDTFLRYSLAMELDKEGDHDASLAKFNELTRDDPPYVPAFFMAAQELARLGRTDEARAFLRDGIESAREQNNLHAAGEMSEFLASLGAIST